MSGEAQARAGSALVETRAGYFAGSPQYVSPEQASGQLVDARSDLYSLGAVLFYLVTGRPPFLANSMLEYLTAHVSETPQGPSTLVPGIPAALDAIILRALEKRPADRYHSASEMQAALALLPKALARGARDTELLSKAPFKAEPTPVMRQAPARRPASTVLLADNERTQPEAELVTTPHASVVTGPLPVVEDSKPSVVRPAEDEGTLYQFGPGGPAEPSVVPTKGELARPAAGARVGPRQTALMSDRPVSRIELTRAKSSSPAARRPIRLVLVVCAILIVVALVLAFAIWQGAGA